MQHAQLKFNTNVNWQEHLQQNKYSASGKRANYNSVNV